MKKALTLIILLLAWLGAESTAHAANESIELSLAAKPNPGPLFKEVARPLDAGLTVSVSTPPTESKITPVKVANVTFPKDMGFFPNESKTPACTEKKLNSQTNLAAGIQAIVALCPRSVIGTGESTVQIGQIKAYTASDPKLVIFNAGRDQAGQPRIVIYGYSASVQAGLLMRGTLAPSGELKISIGVLPFDSSFSRFTMGIPGEPIELEGESGGDPVTIQGLDPAFLRGKCSTGTWRATGAFVLGTRESPSGKPISADTLINSNAYELPCNGRTGKGVLGFGGIVGPKRLAPGESARYFVTVSNRGTATARSVRLQARGAAAGSAGVGNLKPGDSRKVSLKLKAIPRRTKGSVTFRATANGLVYKESVRKLTVG